MQKSPLQKERYRLALLVSNPIPYHVALYRALAVHSAIDLTVLYCSRLGISGQIDPEFDIPATWHPSLLNGYSHRFLHNVSPLSVPGRFFSLINPGIVSTLWGGGYDAVIIPGYACFSYLLGVLAAWVTKTPVLFRAETMLKRESPWSVKTWGKRLLVRAILRGTSACLAIGTPSMAFYRAFGVPAGRIFWSPYGVDNEFFHRESERWKACRAELKRSIGIAPETPVVLFCGKLVPRKRPADLLAAFCKLNRPAALVFVGEGRQRAELERLASGRPDILFPGFIGQQEIVRYYALADLFVLPSERETVALVVAEAMACGLPILLSDAVPSAADFVRPGENGFVFPVGNIGALSSYLERLLWDETLLCRMGQRSLSVIKDWSPQAAVAGILQALNRSAEGIR